MEVFAAMYQGVTVGSAEQFQAFYHSIAFAPSKQTWGLNRELEEHRHQVLGFLKFKTKPSTIWVDS